MQRLEVSCAVRDIYITLVPKRSPPTYIQEKHTVTVHGAPRRRKAHIQWDAAWFPKGIRGIYSDNQWHR